jgi:hypothetical protein
MPPAAGWSKKRFPVAFFTTCDWADKFCDGEIWEQFAGWSPRRISAPDTTAQTLLEETKGDVGHVDPRPRRRLKRPTESVACSQRTTLPGRQVNLKDESGNCIVWGDSRTSTWRLRTKNFCENFRIQAAGFSPLRVRSQSCFEQ